MKRTIIATVTALVSLLVVSATTAEADNYHRRSHIHHHRPAYPSCRVPTYQGRQSYYRAPVQRHSYHQSYSRYPYSRYGSVYSPYHRSQGHVGIHGRNFSLHFGY